ncbi:MAG: sensor domain-containing diguanylate cyclase [Firmicutes bacterium]|nr:sensor domain-containing diguanylate cyclase [[Eubacterium] siraeum]MCM1486960.1 sensor domain-containing diguanylate cyclase [Bacillota bacterium]
MKLKVKTVFKILIVTSILLPAIIVGLAGSFNYNSFFGDMVADGAGSAAYSEAKSCMIFFERYSAQLSTMAQMDSVKRAAGGDVNTVKSQLDAFIKNQVESDNGLLDIVVMDSNGYYVAASNEAILKETYKDFDTLQKTADGSVYISNITASEKYFEDVICIIKPLTASSGSRGYVGAITSAGQLNTTLSSSNFFDHNGVIAFIDSAGKGININGGIAEAKGWIPYDNITADSLASLSGNNRYVAFNNNGFYGSYGKIEGSDWIWIGSYPSSAASLKATPVTLIGLIVFAVFIVLDTIIAFMIYRRAISPIAPTITVMEEINAGNREKRLPDFKTYEFQVISETFNDLIDDFYVSEDVHKTITALSDSMFFEWTLENSALYVSDNFRELFGLDYEKVNAVEGPFLDTLMSDVDARHFLKDMQSLVSGAREYVENEFQVKTTRNTEIWVSLKASAITNRTNDVIRIMGVVNDINNKKKSNLQLSQKASYDFLSQLYNRSTFIKELQKRLDMKRVNEKYAVLFIDVDDFKFINDRYGHNVGDEVIKYVSDTIKACVGEDGIAGRFGGDEFVLCVTAEDKVNVIDEFAMSIIDKLYEGYNCETIQTILNINASVGISFAPDHGKDAEILIGAADEAMYFVKKNGKANYHIFDPDAAPDLDLGNTLT